MITCLLYTSVENIDAFIDETEKTILKVTQDRSAGEFREMCIRDRYHIAFNQSNVFLLEYDHRSKQVSCSSESSAAYFDSAAFSNIPESLICLLYTSRCV